ncbi:hypothetical protein [Roseibium sediminicola]|uniref:Uncharacterized protein n=1 Tax=Roseibium sediminicola TaxID=2933272 RepID=A0ABT0GPP1_9HYPH|nr:hypothetical protein [Roseibium sp. CAU 1639]MCK7611067.1 hypothetical protein [Roseibium sp. CAU 1639]
MGDTLDEIKSNLPIETTTAYAGIMALANRGENIAGHMNAMTIVFVILLLFTAALSLIRTKSLLSLCLAISGFTVWVINIDITRFSNIVANIYNEYLLPSGADPTEFTDGLELILPSLAIFYSVILTIISAAKSKGVWGEANG